MAQNFSVPRNVELSALNYLKTNLAITWNGVTIAKTFSQVYATNVVAPVVCCRVSDTASKYLEIGSLTLEDRYLLVVDIFANSEPQRADLAYSVKLLLAQGWAHYDYSRVSGDTTGTITGVPDGHDTVTDFVSDAPVDLPETVDARDRYRHRISVRVRTSSLVPIP